jgi:hypothetical protein
MLARALVPVGLAGSLALVGCAGRAAPKTEPQSEVLPVSVDGTRLLVRKPDGTTATREELIGAVLVSSREGVRANVRVDAIEPDPNDPTGELFFYTFSMQDPATGAWSNACVPDKKGAAHGFPLAGKRNERGDYLPTPGEFEIACTSGAVGKCVVFGYRPWKSPELANMHEACTRMVRADYCGDGKGHTRDGTPIDVFDRVGIQLDEPRAGMTFEAGWGPDGATCLAHTRVPDVAKLPDIAAECPERLAHALGAECSEEKARNDPRTLLFDKS